MKVEQALNIDVKQKVNVGGEEMSLYEAARWSTLIQGLDVITKRANQLKINLDQDKTWLKPLALQKYIEEETPVAIAEINQGLEPDTSPEQSNPAWSPIAKINQGLECTTSPEQK